MKGLVTEKLITTGKVITAIKLNLPEIHLIIHVLEEAKINEQLLKYLGCLSAHKILVVNFSKDQLQDAINALTAVAAKFYSGKINTYSRFSLADIEKLQNELRDKKELAFS